MTRLTRPRCASFRPLAVACALLALAGSASAGELAGILRPTIARGSASDLGAPIGQAMVGDTYAVSRTQGGWVEIQYTERKAWVKALDVEVREAALKRTTANLNVRVGPSTDHTILATLRRGTWVAERGGNGTWRMISFRGLTAWVHGDFLTRASRTAAESTGRDLSNSDVAATTNARARTGGPTDPVDPARTETVSDEELAAREAGSGRTGATSTGNSEGSNAKGAAPAAREREQQKQAQAPAGENCTAIFESTTYAGERRQMKTGTITINGHGYPFRSGGYGNGNLPPGTYRVTPHMWSRSDASMSVGGVGYSFALNDAFDPRLRVRRTLLRIHPDGGVVGTEGCIGIIGNAAVQRQFLGDMRAQFARSRGGSFTLTVR